MWKKMLFNLLRDLILQIIRDLLHDDDNGGELYKKFNGKKAL
jgi:hypothetical protein